MRFLANENIPAEVIEALRSLGHDLRWVREDARGSSDYEVIEQATSESRILLTFDKDFGELAFRQGLPITSGVVLFRTPPIPPIALTSIIVKIIQPR